MQQSEVLTSTSATFRPHLAVGAPMCGGERARETQGLAEEEVDPLCWGQLSKTRTLQNMVCDVISAVRATLRLFTGGVRHLTVSEAV